MTAKLWTSWLWSSALEFWLVLLIIRQFAVVGIRHVDWDYWDHFNYLQLQIYKYIYSSHMTWSEIINDSHMATLWMQASPKFTKFMTILSKRSKYNRSAAEFFTNLCKKEQIHKYRLRLPCLIIVAKSFSYPDHDIEFTSINSTLCPQKDTLSFKNVNKLWC